MSWWDRRKKKKSELENLCHVCGVNQLPENPAIVRLKVQDGVAEVNVCDECADFFDKSAEVLLRGNKDGKSV
jgi:ribosome-binding protein aMBF1 (putative translation factor)